MHSQLYQKATLSGRPDSFRRQELVGVVVQGGSSTTAGVEVIGAQGVLLLCVEDSFAGKGKLYEGGIVWFLLRN